jgi:hypothetical protein
VAVADSKIAPKNVLRCFARRTNPQFQKRQGSKSAGVLYPDLTNFLGSFISTTRVTYFVMLGTLCYLVPGDQTRNGRIVSDPAAISLQLCKHATGRYSRAPSSLPKPLFWRIILSQNRFALLRMMR